jgi:hypothetical protein
MQELLSELQKARVFLHDNLGNMGDRLLSMKGDDVTIPQRREIWSTAIRHNDAWREAGLSPFIMPDYLAMCRSPSVRKGRSL